MNRTKGFAKILGAASTVTILATGAAQAVELEFMMMGEDKNSPCGPR